MSEFGVWLDREDLLRLFTEVGERLLADEAEGHLYVFGGAAMALTFDSRRTTRDVDAAVSGAQEKLWKAIAQVATRHALPPDWVNNHATAFMTNEADERAAEINVPGLRITVASPEHLIAMKLRAMRDRDLADLDTLFRACGISTPEQAAAIHDRLFDESYIGYSDPKEALYAARLVFERAEGKGDPII